MTVPPRKDVEMGSTLFGAIGYLKSLTFSSVDAVMSEYGNNRIHLYLIDHPLYEFSDADIAFMATMGFDYSPAKGDYSYFSIRL